MKPFNLHTHTQFSDGTGTPEEFILQAIRQGFDIFGFSEHAPVPFENNFAIHEDQLSIYTETTRALQAKYSDKIEILTALETDYIPGFTEDFSVYRKEYNLDYVIGSIHLVKNGADSHLWFIDGPRVESYDEGFKRTFGGDARKAVTAYYHQTNEMIENQEFDIIGHLDKIQMHNKGRYFRGDESWYQALVNECLDLIDEKDIIVEVNTRGIYKKRSDSLFPGLEILKTIHQRSIPITLSSDAHNAVEISLYFDEAIEILKEIGFREVCVLTSNGRITRNL